MAVRSQYGSRFRFWLDGKSFNGSGFNPSILTHTPVHQQQLDAGPRVPTSNHSLNTFGASLLFDPMGYTGPVDITDLVQQEYLSSAFGSNQRIVPPFGTEAVAGG